MALGSSILISVCISFPIGKFFLFSDWKNM